ncbi:MAG TPA: nuclear transport factor 2 family protein [Pyrinomonadaceae bacterium]|nr:nuclear transport factor 2 family protein [Pyrinomonadaceae bacterium]
MKKLILVCAALVLLPASVVAQQPGADAEREAVRQAVLDYVEGIYEVNPARIERSVHPELVKRGFFVKKGETAYSFDSMTFQQLVALAGTYNKNGRVAKDAPKEVVVFDVSDQTASAKLTAVWGIDYIHLARYEGKWKFINVLWQTPPVTNK